MAYGAQSVKERILAPVRAWRRDRRGATAIEFSLLVLPFTLLAFAIIETTVSFTAQQLLTNAADTIARKVRTGQLTLANTSQSEFRAMICDEISVLVGSSCSGLVYDLESYSSFAAVPKEIPRTQDGDIDSTGFGYDPGAESSIVSLRLFYKWPALTDIMKPSMSNMPDGSTLLFATITWQNEPF